MPHRYNKRIKNYVSVSTYIGTELRRQGGHLFLGGVQFSTQLADLERKKNAEQKQVEKGKKKSRRWKEEEKEAHTRDPGVSWKENFVIWYQRGETVCRCMHGTEECCTGGRKDHRDVRWNEIRPWIHPQFVFTTGQWWWINTLLTAMRFTATWGAVCVVFCERKNMSSPLNVISPPSVEIKRHSN